MTIEDNLNTRIRILEEALRDIRDQVEYNLVSPGNENDTFENVSITVTNVLFDDYTFNEEAYLDG